ncbi:MAG TPA: MogA/MoaB family molybdenum cofactor biosynthesis protein, partial [Gemmatimonadaceae bacterium]|nr:MogA/MoaB family molybdenum cofactor biosynthesis protein [Gemmatimonadaceae bacterium]
GERADASGDAIVAWVAARKAILAARSLVADETLDIVRALTAWCDKDEADLVITTGGTGLAPRDVTPEATRTVIEREAPGIAEELRRHGMAATKYSMISRGVAGVRNRTLIVNLPGSPKAVEDGLKVLADVADHAVKLVRGEKTSHTD